MYLLGSSVLSEMRKRARNPGVTRFLETTSAVDLYLSVITIGEVARGIERRRTVDPEFAARLEDWLRGILQSFEDRILVFDLPAAKRWGRLASEVGHAGPDLMIAATAQQHGLAVVTCNVRHFTGAGVEVIDPFMT